MSVYQTPFGSGVLVGDGGNVVENVHNQFGPRDVGGTVGVLKVEGMEEELVIDFDAGYFADDFIGARDFVLPAGAVIKAVYVDVEEEFADATGDLTVGTSETEATNGFTVTDTQLLTTSSYNVTSTLTGTWDAEAPLAANTVIGFVGDDVGGVGKARITIQFYRINRAPSPALPGGPALP